MFDTSVCLQGFGLVPDLVPLGSSWLTVAGSVRSSQEEPGGARRNQEEPGDAARRSWKESMRGAQEKPGKSTGVPADWGYDSTIGITGAKI